MKEAIFLFVGKFVCVTGGLVIAALLAIYLIWLLNNMLCSAMKASDNWTLLCRLKKELLIEKESSK
jgi:hypothetical protein